MKKDWDNCGAARCELLKNSYRVVFRSQNVWQRALPSNPNRHRQSSHDFLVAIEPMSSWCLISRSQYKLGGEALSIPRRRRRHTLTERRAQMRFVSTALVMMALARLRDYERMRGKPDSPWQIRLPKDLGGLPACQT